MGLIEQAALAEECFSSASLEHYLQWRNVDEEYAAYGFDEIEQVAISYEKWRKLSALGKLIMRVQTGHRDPETGEEYRTLGKVGRVLKRRDPDSERVRKQ